MHGGDAGEAAIIGIQGRRDGAEPGHDSLDFGRVRISAAEQAFDVVLRAHDKMLAAPLDQRRATEQQSIGRAGQAEIVVTCFAETPELDRRRRVISRIMRQKSMIERHKSTKSLILHHIPPRECRSTQGHSNAPKS